MTNPPTNLTLDSGPRDDDERLVRYIAGECSPRESARIQEWIAADPARWNRFQELERVWRACASEPSRRWNAESALGQLRGLPEPPAEHEERRRPSVAPLTLRRARGASLWPWKRGAMGIAAALAIAAAGAVGSRSITGHWPARVVGNDGPVPLQEVATARAQRATITLSDGTRIILGAESSVRYARDFGVRARRDVYLDGQAYFEVAHDSLRPLAVHTSRGVAEDLGTEFVVTAYSAMPEMQVVVASGQVLLRHGAAPGPDSAVGGGKQSAEPLTLGPGELGVIDSSGALSRSRVADTAPYFDWTKGELSFRGVPLAEALPAISRWYDMEITIGDSSLASRRLVASFGPHSAHDVVRLIALAVNARYEERGDTVVLLPRRPARR